MYIVSSVIVRRMLSWQLHRLDLSRPIVAATQAQSSRDCAVGSLKIKALWIKFSSEPAPIVPVPFKGASQNLVVNVG